MTNKTRFIWHNFDSISKEQLYDVLSLRQRVFIIEQDCFYEDLDYSDQEANHLLLYKDNKLIGYSRVFAPGIKYDAASIGRIVTDLGFRGKGYGKDITQESIQFLKNNFLHIHYLTMVLDQNLPMCNCMDNFHQKLSQ